MNKPNIKIDAKMGLAVVGAVVAVANMLVQHKQDAIKAQETAEKAAEIVMDKLSTK